MHNNEILNKRYMLDCQSFTDKDIIIMHKNGVFGWPHYTLMINDEIVEKIKAETDQAARNALYDRFIFDPGDYVKIVKVITTYETTYMNYE